MIVFLPYPANEITLSRKISLPHHNAFFAAGPGIVMHQKLSFDLYHVVSTGTLSLGIDY